MEPRSHALGWLPAFVVMVGAALLVPTLATPAELPCHRDLLDFFIPMKVQFARALSAGELPFWDPLTLGGHPFFANLQSQVFYPPNGIFAALPLPLGLSVFLALHFAIAGLGALHLARVLGRSRPAAVLAAFAFMAGGYFASLGDLNNQHCTLAWMPWACAAAIAHGRSGSARALAGWVAACSLALLAGEPQVALLGGLLSGALAMAAAPPRRRARSVLASAAVGLAVAACCAVQLVPFLELVAKSDRTSRARIAVREHALDGRAATALWSRPRGAFDGPAGPYVRSLYLGVPVVALAAAGAVRRERLTRALVAAAVVSVLLAAAPHLPGLSALPRATPWLRHPIKYAAPAALLLPLLAASGLDLVLQWARGAAPRSRSALTFGATALVAMLAVDLVLAHRRLLVALPAHALLAPTPVLDELAKTTAPDGPRVHAAPASAERLARRARRIARGDLAGALREKVELLEGGLPAVFGISSTTGGAALTLRDHARRLDEIQRRPAPSRLKGLGAGWLLADEDMPVAAPLVPVQLDGGSARLFEVPGADALAGPRTWDGANRCMGPAGLPPPSTYPGWREGPAGTWTYRPRGWLALALVSLTSWLAAAIIAWRGSPRAPDESERGREVSGAGREG